MEYRSYRADTFEQDEDFADEEYVDTLVDEDREEEEEEDEEDVRVTTLHRSLGRVPGWDVLEHDALRAEIAALNRRRDDIPRRATEAQRRVRQLTHFEGVSREERLGGEVTQVESTARPAAPADEVIDDEDEEGGGEYERLARATHASLELYEARKQAAEATARAEREVQAEKMRSKDEIDTLRKRVEELEKRVTSTEESAPEEDSDKDEYQETSKGGGKRMRLRSSTTQRSRKATAAKPAAKKSTKKVAAVPPAPRESITPKDTADCLVCLEPLASERGMLLPCKHARYHYNCAMELFARNGKCASHSSDNKVTSVERIYV